MGALGLMAVPFPVCMALSAVLNHLPVEVLPAIQRVEGGTIGTVSHNRNGTDDLGVMQVNTLWIPRVAWAMGLGEGETRARLINNACFNIVVAGSILQIYVRETGGNLWQAVGDYHSHTPVHNLPYQAKVLTGAVRMLNERMSALSRPVDLRTRSPG